jgi:predicted metal-dependent phosphoesterase TrpH
VGKADLHLHTRVSDGLAKVDELLTYVEHETDLDLMAVTDHEDLSGGQRAREAAARRGMDIVVVVGAEITTNQGHLLALGIERCPKSFRSIEKTLEDVHAQGGLAIAPHPQSWLTRSISVRTIDRLQRLAEPGITFDAVETANPSPAGKLTRSKALQTARRWELAETGSSDAHHLLHTGTGWTEYPGSGFEALRAAIVARTTIACMSRYPSLRDVGYRRAALGLAWGYAATPRKMLRLGQHPRRVV